jgi:hypothetical protein
MFVDGDGERVMTGWNYGTTSSHHGQPPVEIGIKHIGNGTKV